MANDMKMDFLNKTVVAAAGTALSAAGQEPAVPKRPEALISMLASTNEAVRAAAVETAPEYGATAVRPLGFTLGSGDFELARRARQALQRIVRDAGRPGADPVRASGVETKLLPLLGKGLIPIQARRELLWILSEIGTARSVEPVAALLADKDLREDARCVLTRLPYPEAVAALKAAFSNAEASFKDALADSLRARGETVGSYGSKKLVPTAQTTVKPAQPK
jgi:hypothetical protein